MNGWAVAYRRYSTGHVGEETVARQVGAGIWSGAFEMSWDWRRAKPVEATHEQPADTCRIKGNISRSGERIYHVPGRRHYDRTRIDETKGERWFCSEAEASNAGWRRSLK